VGFSDAAVRATLECVERDAWIVSWEQRLTRAVIEFDDCCRGLRRLRRALTANGEQLWCIDITSDLGIPVVLAVSLRTGDSMVCFATSAAWRMHDAVWGALEELAQSQSLVPKLIRQRGVPAGMEQVRRMEDHYTYYCRADRVAELEFLWSGPATRLMHETEPPEPVRLEELAGRLYGCGHEVVVVDVTTCDSRACGVNVVRSVVPGLLPLTYSLRVRRRDHPRLYEVPGRLGISPLARTRDELSDLPRPGA
jgi:ribosomal protein S12 methylthiotransferase accessory factor